MQIVVLTTSHGQITQVESLLSSLTEFAQNSSSLKLNFVVVESFLNPGLYCGLKDRFSGFFESFEVLSVDSGNYWTGSIFSGLDFVTSLSHEFESIKSSRIVLVNCDVLPSSWNFLLKPKALLETLSTVDLNNVVKRSGFSLPSPFLAVHHYPYKNKSLPKSDWFCKTVPTRLIVFPFEALSIILAHRYLIYLLPHYSADFVLTSLVSSKLLTYWCVRADFSLTEDESTTGLKHISSLKIVNIKAVLFSRKSVFNICDAFFFPIFYSTLSLPFYCFPTYVFSYWSKYLVKLVVLFVIAFFDRLFSST